MSDILNRIYDLTDRISTLEETTTPDRPAIFDLQADRLHDIADQYDQLEGDDV